MSSPRRSRIPTQEPPPDDADAPTPLEQQQRDEAIRACLTFTETFARRHLLVMCMAAIMIALQIATVFVINGEKEAIELATMAISSQKTLDLSAKAIASKVARKVGTVIVSFVKAERAAYEEGSGRGELSPLFRNGSYNL